MLNTDSQIASILLQPQEKLDLTSPTFLLEELSKKRSKLCRLLDIKSSQYIELRKLVTRNIKFIEEEKISLKSWLTAERITSNIDSDDIAFVALSIEYKCTLWTGDKRIRQGITDIEIIDTTGLKGLLKRINL